MKSSTLNLVSLLVLFLLLAQCTPLQQRVNVLEENQGEVANVISLMQDTSSHHTAAIEVLIQDLHQKGVL